MRTFPFRAGEKRWTVFSPQQSQQRRTPTNLKRSSQLCLVAAALLITPIWVAVAGPYMVRLGAAVPGLITAATIMRDHTEALTECPAQITRADTTPVLRAPITTEGIDRPVALYQSDAYLHHRTPSSTNFFTLAKKLLGLVFTAVRIAAMRPFTLWTSRFSPQSHHIHQPGVGAIRWRWIVTDSAPPR